MAAVVGYGVIMALQPLDEEPPPPSPEAAASFDQKLLGLLAVQAGSGAKISFAETELNAKLALTVAGSPLPAAVKTVYLRLLPEDRVTVIGLGEVYERPVALTVELRVTNDDGPSVVVEQARLGELPLPTVVFTGLVLPILRAAGLPLGPVAALSSAVQQAHTDGPNLVLTR